MDAAADAARQEAQGAPADAQAGLSKPSVSAYLRGDCAYQSHSAGLGAVLGVRPFKPLLRVRPRLGGEEDSAPRGTSKPASRFRAEAMESRVAVRNAGALS